MRGSAQPDGRPLGVSDLRSYFSPFVDQSTSVVTKAVDAETETKTEAVYLKTEAEAQGSWPILLTVLSSGAVLVQKF